MEYKIKMPLRPYQEEALRQALEFSDSVICLPTGTGKTLVGCAWCCELLNSARATRILVLEPSRFLVEQVTSYYQENTDIPASKCYGTTLKRERPPLWREGKVVVTTPQTACSDLDLLDFDAAVIDECHHTTGEHAYAKLMEEYPGFSNKLGLSATIPQNLVTTIEDHIGPIRRWKWTDPLVAPFVPDWYGEVYDADLCSRTVEVINSLKEIRKALEGTQEQGLVSMAIRMIVRDGILSLVKTLEGSPKMGDLLGSLLPDLKACPPLHKLEQARKILEQHEFHKAILFVNRVVVAKWLVGEFSEYNPVLLVGRLHQGSCGQEEAVRSANETKTRLVVSTSAGEEGVDLPKADLLIVWSNQANPVRFIQRQGRIMRKQRDGQLKVATYISTPETVDYDALIAGFQKASEAGLDIDGIEAGSLVSKSVREGLRRFLSTSPMTFTDIMNLVTEPKRILKKRLNVDVREGRMLYFYKMALESYTRAGILRFFSDDFIDEEVEAHPGRYKSGLDYPIPFGFSIEDRIYCLREDIPILLMEYGRLFDPDPDTYIQMQFSYDFKMKERIPNIGNFNSGYASGNYKQIYEQVIGRPDYNKIIYINVGKRGRRGGGSINVSYHGKYDDDLLLLVIKNACWLATKAENIDK